MDRQQHRPPLENPLSCLPNSLPSNRRTTSRQQHQPQRGNPPNSLPSNHLSKGNLVNRQRHHNRQESLQSSRRSSLRNRGTVVSRQQLKHGDLLQHHVKPRTPSGNHRHQQGNRRQLHKPTLRSHRNKRKMTRFPRTKISSHSCQTNNVQT